MPSTLHRVLLLLCCFCATTSVHADITLHDDNGQLLRLPQTPKRIVSLTPHITELLFAAGAGPRIVGASEYSDYPAAARRIPRIGGALLDLERIAALKPDVIIAWADGNSQAQLQALKPLGVPIFLSSQKRLEDIPISLERLGQLAGTEPLARRAATQFRQELKRLHDTYSGRTKLRVFYQVWDKPLLTINGQHIISHAISTCGGENIFAQLPALTPSVSIENVLQADPDAIVASSQDGKQPARLQAWQRWTRLKAVRQQHLLVVHADWMDRPAPRILLGVDELCRMLDQVRGER